MSTKQEAPRTLVVDLDSTLIYSRPADIARPFIEDERNFYVKPLSEEIIYHTTVRKHAHEFLKEAENRGYRMIIWSAGHPAYIKDIISVLFNRAGSTHQLTYLLTRDNLKNKLKDLRVIKDFVSDFDVASSRLIDDNLDHSIGQKKWFILVDAFVVDGRTPTLEEDDDVLATLMDRIEASYA